jgi:hypothetical protein
MLPKFELVCEAIYAFKARMLSVGKDGYKRLPAAAGVIPPHLAESASRIPPQHLQRVVLPTSPEQGRCLHLAVSFSGSIRV